MLKAGVALADITPKESCYLMGYPDAPDRFAAGTHDPLFCSAFYFENGGTELLYFTNDLVAVSKVRADEARALLAAELGIPRANIAIACTHTHSGPNTTNDRRTADRFADMADAHPAYNDFLRDIWLRLGREARENAFEAQLGAGRGRCGAEKNIGGNRHGPDGTADPEVLVLAVKDMRDRVRGVLVNYALHPTLLHKDNLLYTADYPGYLRTYINALYPDAVFGFVEGCAGNQSTRFFRTGQSFDEAKRYGDTIGAEAARVLGELVYASGDVTLAAVETQVTPPLKDALSPDEARERVERGEAELAKLRAEGADYTLVRTAECTLFGAQFGLSMAEGAKKHGIDSLRSYYFPMTLQALRLGSVGIACISSEAFVEIGLGIKKASPFDITLVSTITSGYCSGYACADYAYDEFCYEAQASMFKKGAADFLVAEETKLLRKAAER